jgi:hypothetical protein
MAAGGTPGNVKLGPGRLWYAPLGTAEPTDASTVLPIAWLPIGYTENGTEIVTTVTAEDIEVAEEFDPIDNIQTKRVTVLNVEMAESTKRNLLLAIAGGSGAAATNDGIAFEFPDADQITGVMMVWESTLSTPDSTNRRWLLRTAKPNGTITTVRRKAPAKSSITASFTCVKSAAGLRAVKVFPNALGQV